MLIKQRKWKGKKEVNLWCNIKIIRGGRRDGCDRGSDGVMDRRWSTCIITDPEEEHMKIVLETRREEQRLQAVSTGLVTLCLHVSCWWSSVSDLLRTVCLHPQMSISDSPPSSICMFALHHQSSSSPAGPLNPDSSSMSGQMSQVDTGLYGQPMTFPKTPDGRSMEQMMGFVPYSSCLTPSSTDRAAQQNQQVTQTRFKPLPGELLYG